MAVHKTHDVRKESILAAARKVAREDGLRGTNVRAIAREAGTSPASVLYYYTSIDALIEAAIEHVFSEYYIDRRKLIDDDTDPLHQLQTLIEHGVPDNVGEDMGIVYEVAANLNRYPEFAEPMRALHERQVELYGDVIDRGVRAGLFFPQPDVATVARNIVALEDTYDFYPLIGMTISRELLRENVRSYARVALGANV